MPIIADILAVLLILLSLALMSALLAGTILLSQMRRFHHQHTFEAWDISPRAYDQDLTSDDLDGEVEDWVPVNWSGPAPANATAWWWSTGGTVPEMIIDTRTQSDANTVAENAPTTRDKIWTIHSDHTAHWLDEAANCQLCRNEAREAA